MNSYYIHSTHARNRNIHNIYKSNIDASTNVKIAIHYSIY